MMTVSTPAAVPNTNATLTVERTRLLDCGKQECLGSMRFFTIVLMMILIMSGLVSYSQATPSTVWWHDWLPPRFRKPSKWKKSITTAVVTTTESLRPTAADNQVSPELLPSPCKRRDMIRSERDRLWNLIRLFLRGGADRSITRATTAVTGESDSSSILVSSVQATVENSTYWNTTAATTITTTRAEENGANETQSLGADNATYSNTRSNNNNERLSLIDRKRLLFLDRIALISSSWMKREVDAAVHFDSNQQSDLDSITPESDLARPGRYFHIVTTAALPWFTGTAVNPLLRAAYLHRRTVELNHANHLSTGNGTLAGTNTTTTTPASDTDDTPGRYVTLVIPWLELEQDQQELYGRVFANPAEQEHYIRQWLIEQAQMPDVADERGGLRIVFYPARYHSGLRSIFAMGDMLKVVEDANTGPMDVCVLEEPEHVNWFRAPGDGWTYKYTYVVGIMHTNYKEYASSHYSGLWTAPAISMVSSAMVRAYCHKVIKLSPVLQTYAPEKEVTSNVHGVRAEFWMEGLERAKRPPSHNSTASETPIYFIGKLLWAKGLDIMLELEDYYKQCVGSYFPIDIYGSGPEQGAIMRGFLGRRKIETQNLDDAHVGAKNYTQTKKKRNPLQSIFDTTLSIFGGTRGLGRNVTWQPVSFETALPSLEAIQEGAMEKLTKLRQTLDSVELPQTFAELRRQPVPATFPGRVDHAELKRHKIFVNPSISEVLCTTTAEALAMGKFAIIPVHPSNSFFMKFPNCLAYRSKFEFVANLRWALTHEPEPLTEELIRQFTWEAATDRFIEASSITVREALERERRGMSKLDERIAWFHNEIGKGITGDMLRKIFGAGPVSNQVKYIKEQGGDNGSTQKPDAGDDSDDNVGDDLDEDEDDGLSRKFRRSSLAEAIRATVGDLSSFIQ